MKRLLYTIINLFILVGCHQDNIELSQQPPTDGEKVTISLSVQIPEAQSAMSRAFNDDGSNIDTLCLVVFNENNYLSEVAWAYDLKYTPTDYTAAEDEVCFKVNLKRSGSTRYIHFIAYQNDDVADTEDIEDELTTQLNNIQYGAEATIMSALNVSGTKDAYWQRLELPEIRNNDETKNAMRRVPLVRNFAKITVTNNAGNFAITRIAVVTPPSKGSIAPYFDGDFAVFNDANAHRSYETILGTGYYGYSPSDYLPNNNVLGPEVAWTENATSVSTYLYERNQRTNTDKLTYLLIEGKYNNRDVSYYKLDLVDANGDRYNILRNFNYNVRIESVVGDGLSYDDALANAPGNNISGSVEAQNFLNISDGTGQLFVSYVKKTIVSDDAVTLMYKYIPDLDTDTDNDGNPDVNNAAVTITPQVKTSDNVFASKASGINGYDIVPSSTDETGENAGWRTITIKPNKPGDNPITQMLTLKGGSLQRTITYTLHEAYNLIADCDEVVNRQMNSKMEVYIYIPTDLPDYIFPLTFFIEADKRSIYPDAAKDNNNMYTSFGPSNNEHRTENTFGFDKELSLSDYDDLGTEPIDGVTYKKITCHFLTNIDESASDIYVYNELFNLGQCSFTNPAFIEITGSTLVDNTLTWYVGDNADNSGKSLTVTVTPANVDYSLNTLSNFNVTKSEDGKTLTITPNNDAVPEDKIVDVDDEELVLTTTDGTATAKVKLQIIEKPLEWSIELAGEQYYGEDKTVTLTLKTNKPGDYIVSFTEVGEKEKTATITIKDGETEGITEYTTQGWSGKISAVVTSPNEKTLPIEGDNRNRLLIKTNNSNYNRNTTFKLHTSEINRNNWDSNWNGPITAKESNTLENGIEFEINNLESDVTYYLAYRTGRITNRTYYNESMSAADFATENVKITFEQ